jgi:peptidoglycan/LPS O-acetylase OafA/YrhL
MNEPWFDPNAWAWLPGTLFGCLGGLWGGMVGTLAPMGRARKLVICSGIALVVIAGAFLAAGVAALAVGQPYGIWYGLLLPGVLGLILIPCLLPVIRMAYREAEERRMQAADLG